MRNEVVDDGILDINRLCRSGLLRLIAGAGLGLRLAADYDIEAVEYVLVFLVQAGDDLIIDVAAGLLTDAGSTGLRCSDLEGVDDCIILSRLFFVLTECVDDFALCSGIVVELRHCHVGFAECCVAALVIDLAEVERHLDTCDALVLLNGPVDRQLLACLSIVGVVAGRVISNSSVLLAVRNEVVDDGVLDINSLARSRLLRFIRRRRCTGIAVVNLNSQSVEDVAVFLIHTGNDLVEYVAAGFFANRYRAGLRCFHLERIDNRIIFCGFLFVLTEGVNDFALCTGVIIELRHCHVSLAELCLADLIVSLAEIKCHLETGDSLIVLNSPVNRQRFARLGSNSIVAL